MKIAIIAALANKGVIGNKNKLPWHLPADLRHFKELTLGKPIIMGRKTYESIGKPLPGRRNIVLTRDQNWQCAGCEVYHNLAAALAALAACDEVMIIGGSELYTAALSQAGTMYLTFIQHDFIGDSYFPVWKQSEWQEVEKADYPADNEAPYAYSFVRFKRVANSDAKKHL
ncbi:MAG: dihydrofolate reductase [Gammaproteobacteria bacterium]|nr:dihydrofolate reductase [Gammaproteobacteria bacterium]